MAGNLKSAGPFAQDRRVSWGSFSTGLAYNSTVYNAEEPDPRMEAVGLSNALVRLGITVANDSPISLGLGILHTSNGGLRRLTKASTRRRRNSLFGSWRRLVVVCTWTVQHPRISSQPLVWGWVDATMRRTAGTFTAFKLFAQTAYVVSPRYGLTAQAAVVHHGALRADPNTDAPSDTLAPTCWTPSTWVERGLVLNVWSCPFGLDQRAVLVNPTPGFIHGYNKTRLFLSVHPTLDAFV